MKAEIRRALIARFDADGDGKLTGAERVEARRAAKQLRKNMKLVRRLHRLDANHDGWLDQDELMRGRSARARAPRAAD